MYDVCLLDVDCYFHHAAICAICVTILNIKQGMSIFLWKIYPVPNQLWRPQSISKWQRSPATHLGGGSPVLAARRINIMTGRALNILIGQVLLALHCTAGSRNNSVSLMPSPTQLQLHNVMIVIVILIVTCSLTYKRILDTLTNTNTHMHTHRPHKGISSV